MLTREEFVGYFDFIEKQKEKQEKLCQALEENAGDGHCDFFVYGSYEMKLIELLALNIADGVGRIGDIDNTIYDAFMFFICDWEYGHNYKKGDVTVNGVEYSINNAGEFYDYLMAVYNN